MRISLHASFLQALVSCSKYGLISGVTPSIRLMCSPTRFPCIGVSMNVEALLSIMEYGRSDFAARLPLS